MLERTDPREGRETVDRAQKWGLREEGITLTELEEGKLQGFTTDGF